MNTRSIRFRLTAWYAGLLALLLVLFGGSTWFGLAHYLRRSHTDSLARQAHQIGEDFLLDVQTSGERYVIDEINEHYSPERNDHFVRVTRADGSTLYVSGVPINKGFDPAQVSAAQAFLPRASARAEHLPGGGELLIYSLPFTARDGSRFLIESGAPYDAIEDALRGLLLTLALGLPVVIAVAVGGGYWIMRRALRPLDEIASGAERITSHNLNERLPAPHSGDEVERLALALNRMIARLDESFQYIRRFTADASHELRTPLTVLRGELEAMAQHPRLDDEMRETVGSSLEETERLTKIVESLLVISRLDAGEAQVERIGFDLAELAVTTTEQMRLLADDKKIKLEVETNGPALFEGDPARIKQVIVNLVDNAIKYTPEDGEVRVSVFDKEKPGGLPKDFSAALTGSGREGVWIVMKDDASPGQKNVLAQTDADPTSYRFPVCVYDKFSAKDADVSVKFKAVSGKKDQAAGLVWRYRDQDNYYIVRANALEDNVVLYKMQNGKREDLPVKGEGRTYGKKAKAPSGQWNTLRVTAAGNLFTVYLNGEKLYEVEDGTFTDVGAGAVTIGLFGTAKDFFDAIYQYPGGWLADRLGRRRAFLIFIAIASLGYLIYLFSPAWPFVFAGLAFVMA